MKLISIVSLQIFLIGCSMAPPKSPESMASLHICHELLTGDSDRGLLLAEEMKKRNENCESYQAQLKLMIDGENQRRANAAAALKAYSDSLNKQNKSMEDAYWEPQRKLKQNAPINCISRPAYGGVVNTTCQ